MGRTVLLIALVLSAALWSERLDAQEPLWGGALAAKVDSLAEATLSDGRVSGLSIGVMKGQDLLVVQGYGFADLDHRAPAGPHTVYNIASVTKQFTAAAILQLSERGALELDAALTEVLPGFDTQGHTVTIRHLLSHTSGIRSYPSSDTPYETLAQSITNEELLARIEGEPFDFAPGESFRYSNAGYVLLGLIVEAASGMTYAEYVDEYIFGPAGMARSSVCDRSRITPGRARGYRREDSGLRLVDLEVSYTHMGGAGALCSTAFDLLAWQAALTQGTVISADSYEAMTTAVLLDGSPLPYGFGVQVRPRLEGRLTVFHGGGATGFSTRLDYYPDEDLTIAVLSNTYGSHSATITDVIARWALGIPMPTVADETRSAEEVDRYVGRYTVSTPDQEWTLFRRAGSLFLQIDSREPVRLKSQGDHVFVPDFSAFTRLTFEIGEAGQASGFALSECQVMNQTRCRSREATRVP